MMGERTSKPVETPIKRALLVFPTSIPSSIVETTTAPMESSENDNLRAFKLFLELVTPAEFSRLLTSRVQHLLRVWPPQTAATVTPTKGTSRAISGSNLLSIESICAFLTFFRTQDSPKLPSSDLTTSTSVQTLYDHLVALQTLLSVSSPREIQTILWNRFNDIVEDGDAVIQGFLDVLRSNIEEGAEDIRSKQGSNAEYMDKSILGGVPSSSKLVTRRTHRVVSETMDSSKEESPRKRRRTIIRRQTEIDPESNQKQSDKRNSTLITRSSVASDLANTSPRRSRRISGLDADFSGLPQTRLRSRSSADGQGPREKPTAQSKEKTQDDDIFSEDEEELKRPAHHVLRSSVAGRPFRFKVDKPMALSRPSSDNDQDREEVDSLVGNGERGIPTRITRSKRIALSSSADSGTAEGRRTRSKTVALSRPAVTQGKRKRLSERDHLKIILDKDTELSEIEAIRANNEPAIQKITLEETKTSHEPSATHGDTQLHVPAVIRPTSPCDSIDKGAQSTVTEPPPSISSSASSDGRASPPGPVLRAVNWANGGLSLSVNAELDDIDGPDDDSVDASNMNGQETPHIQSIPSTPVVNMSADSSPALYGGAMRDDNIAHYGSTENTNNVDSDPADQTLRMPSLSHDKNGDDWQARKEVAPVSTAETFPPKTPGGQPYESPQGPIFTPNGNTPQYSSFHSHVESGPSPTITSSIPQYALPPPVQTSLHTSSTVSAPSTPPSDLSPSLPPHNAPPQQQQTHSDAFPYRTVPLHPVPTGSMPPQPMSHPPPQATSHFGPPPPPPPHPYSIPPPSAPHYPPHYPPPQMPQGPPSSGYSSGPWVGTMLYVPYRGPPTAPPPGPLPPPGSPTHFGPPPYGSSPQHPQHPSHSQHSPYSLPQHASHQPFLYHNPYPPHQPQHFQRTHLPPHYQHHQAAPPRQNHHQQQDSSSHMQPTPVTPPSQKPIPPPTGPLRRSFHQSIFRVTPVSALRRTSSPPVKPPEGPKRNVSGRRPEEEENSDASPNSPSENPELTYTDNAGMKETPLVRRRCHNCDAIDAPSWRKSKLASGKILCNKCGIYESTHQAARPLRTRPRRTYYGDTQKKKKKYQREVLGLSEEVTELIKEGASFDFVLR